MKGTTKRVMTVSCAALLALGLSVEARAHEAPERGKSDEERVEKTSRQDASSPRELASVDELRDHVKLLQGDFAAYRESSKGRAKRLRAMRRVAVEIRALVLDTSFADEADRTEALRLLSEVVEGLLKVEKDPAFEEKLAELLTDCVTALDTARDVRARTRPKLSCR